MTTVTFVNLDYEYEYYDLYQLKIMTTLTCVNLDYDYRDLCQLRL